MKKLSLNLLTLMMFTLCPHVFAETNSLETAMQRFSDSTRAGGKGWQAYADYLHKDLSRWYPGRKVFDKETLVNNVRDWWEDGTRVAESQAEILQTDRSGNLAVVRKKVHESYTDGEGNDNGSFEGYVTQVWLLENGEWKLLSMDIHPE